MNREATLANLLTQTFTEIAANARLVGIYIALTIPLSAVGYVFQDGNTTIAGYDLGFGLGENFLALGLLAAFLVFAAVAASILLQFWLYAGFVRGVTTFDLRRFWPWIGIYLLSGAGIGFGLLLLIAPGIILAVRWIAVLPLVVEGKIPAMDTFTESWRMTHGWSWQIFGAGIILFILYWGLAGSVAGFSLLVEESNTIIEGILTAILDTSWTIISCAFVIGAFRLLRDETNEIAEVFD